MRLFHYMYNNNNNITMYTIINNDVVATMYNMYTHCSIYGMLCV